MQKYDYLIIGGGVAGVTAAETIRENDSRSSIAIVSDEPRPLYSRVMLPAYLKKNIAREKLFLRKADDFLNKKIDLLLREKVSFADFRKKEVGLTNRTIIGYGKLLIASGAHTAEWGRYEEQDFIYHLQTLDDADRLFKVLPGISTSTVPTEVGTETDVVEAVLPGLPEIKQPLVVGASFISLEFLEIFVANGITPSVLIRNNHFLEKILDPVGGEILRNNFERYGIRVQSNDSVGEIKKTNEGIEVTTKGLRKIECGAIALGIGIERNIGFLTNSGIELGEKGVRANEFLETSEAGVFAAGDVAEFYDLIPGIHRVVGNWTNAFLQGKRVGLNMLGKREPFKNVTGYSITNFGFQITALGYLGKELETITRMETKANQYERFFIKDGVLVGAALINRFQDKPHLAKLIENKIRIEEFKDKLRDFKFDIGNIQI